MGIGSELKTLRHPEKPTLKGFIRLVAFCGAVALGMAADAHYHPDTPTPAIESTVSVEEVIHSDQP